MTWKSKGPLVILVLGVGYAAAYVYILSYSKKCNVEPGSVPPLGWIQAWLSEYLRCKGINELGDALSGFFAPLAFLGLVWTLIIQGSEIRAQVEESRENRATSQYQRLSKLLRETYNAMGGQELYHLYPNSLIAPRHRILDEKLIYLRVPPYNPVDQSPVFTRAANLFRQFAAMINTSSDELAVVYRASQSLANFQAIFNDLSGAYGNLSPAEKHEAAETGIAALIEEVRKFQHAISELPFKVIIEHSANQPSPELEQAFKYVRDRAAVEQLVFNDHFTSHDRTYHFMLNLQNSSDVKTFGITDAEVEGKSDAEIISIARKGFDNTIQEIKAAEDRLARRV